jgi:outer membrane immunogenic protein
MVRHLLMISACAFAVAGTALAADLPSKAPPPVMPPPPIWDGFYAGLNAGGDWGGSSAVTTTDYPTYYSPNPPGNPWSPEAELTSTLANTVLGAGKGAFIGGGQIGYNYTPSPNWLLGLETDFQGVAGAHSTASTGGAGILPPPNADETIVSASTATKSIQYLGTVRGRIGYEFMPTMLAYATGGLAYGGVKSSSSIWQNDLFHGPSFSPDNAGDASYGDYSKTRAGWVVGGGVEWMFMPNWSLKAEYLHYDLGRATYGMGGLAFSDPLEQPGLLYASSPLASTRFNGNIVRAGINYHFSFGAPAPVVAKY